MPKGGLCPIWAFPFVKSVKSSPILYLSVTSIDDAYVQLKNVGVTFIDEPHCVTKMDTTETWMSFFKDSEDNVLALFSEMSS